MPRTRHLIIDTTKTPNEVVDEITFETDPDAEDFETLHVSEGFHAIQTRKGAVGWIWSEEEGLAKA